MLSIAVPDSLLLDESELRGKTVKIGAIARTASIFGVERLYIYRDSSGNFEGDFQTTKVLLEYVETPQYLRKRLIAKQKNLEFAGLMPPLRIPHHVKTPRLEVGEVREAATVLSGGIVMADVGVKELSRFEGRGQVNQRVTVRIESISPLSVKQCERPKDVYWGYEVRRAPTLTRFLRSSNFGLVILTSRAGVMIHEVWTNLIERVGAAERILVCFGSPEFGLDSMLSQDGAKPSDIPNSISLNTFPFQNVETVRLEEAILGSLSILNVAKRL